MRDHDVLEAELAAWLEGEARAAIPPDAAAPVVSAALRRRPRPKRLAALGSHMIAPASSASSVDPVWPGALHRYSITIALLIIVLLLLAAGAALAGSRKSEPAPISGALVYALDGDIYLANPDGIDPTRVADGVPAVACPSPLTSCDALGPSYFFGDGGPIWAPDGQHFLYFGLWGQQGTAYISDAAGRIVASIPGAWVDATWSPDSTHLEAWIIGIGSTELGIYGVDGALLASLPVPTGYARFREFGGVWTPDGQAVWARIARTDSSSEGVWRMPVDGSPPSQLAENNLVATLSGLSLSPDGRLAGTSADGSLIVTDAAGQSSRPLVTGTMVAGSGSGASGPIWSPTGKQIVYVWANPDGATYDIRVVEATSAVGSTVVAGIRNGAAPLGWSLDGALVLTTQFDDHGQPALWSRNPDGSDQQLLVAGPSSGAWRPHAP